MRCCHRYARSMQGVAAHPMRSPASWPKLQSRVFSTVTVLARRELNNMHVWKLDQGERRHNGRDFHAREIAIL